MKVWVIDAATQVAIAIYTIEQDNFKGIPEPGDYIDKAWECAVRDSLVKEKEREKYEFRLGL